MNIHDSTSKTQPTVSVKMLTYNHGTYLVDAIESVLNQSTQYSFELVIADDFSTDGSRQIAQDYATRYPNVVRLLPSDKNIGAQQNNIRAETSLRGRYVANCEGDDYWHRQDKLERQVSYLEQHPEVGLVHSNFDQRAGNTTEIEKSVRPKEGKYDDIFSGLLQSKYRIKTCTACIRKSVLDQAIDNDGEILYHPQLKLGDVPRWLSLSRLSGVHYMDESLATYRVLPESASHSDDRIRLLSFRISGVDARLMFAKKYDAKKSIVDELTQKQASFQLEKAGLLGDSALARRAWKVMRAGKRNTMLDDRFYYTIAQLPDLFRLTAFKALGVCRRLRCRS